MINHFVQYLGKLLLISTPLMYLFFHVPGLMSSCRLLSVVMSQGEGGSDGWEDTREEGGEDVPLGVEGQGHHGAEAGECLQLVTTCESSSELLELPFETHEYSSFSHFLFYDMYLYLYPYLNLY